MEPANKPPVNVKRGKKDETEIDFLPDADAIERNPLPRFVRLTLHVLLGAFAFFIIWACVSPVEKIVIAHGKLVNPLPNIVVQPLDTSIIQSLNVRVGQVVKKGQVLATLDPTFTAADESQLRTRFESLQNQTSSLRAELAGKPGATVTTKSSDDAQLQAQLSVERKANYEAQKSKMDENIARLKAGLDTNLHDQGILAQRVKSLREVEAMQEQLMAEQFGAKMHLLEARDRRLEVERDMDLQRNKATEMKRELASAQAERAAFEKNWRQKSMEDLLSASRERDSIAEQLAKADKRNKMIQMVAPADAVVLEIAKLSVGSIVREAEPLFTLVPLGNDLEAEVQIDSQDVGFIKVGALAHLKVDAFSFQEHGMLDGKVRFISQDSFKRETPEKNGSEAYFLSRIPFSGQLRKLPGDGRLLPGMTVTAEIVVGHRTVMSYLMFPLTRALDESIREP
ncbi:HlyD family type I secretion periplasmic adaptor subunit [Duganella sp. FT80W]|uniref:Membrane fusion protein (MFP) family protein n=1 Tax=Duganella guangzhouensis TaxID=2666084 RepID=A0A6I2KXF5_9BURK|nr:HlyD family type I secretion periplasmic adaptor subunit [Duganella guangzhouensis]MRW90443.1 HlyD family type I secretion periplasmic adaptor subunit [Duganella guangzhouensis]